MCVPLILSVKCFSDPPVVFGDKCVSIRAKGLARRGEDSEPIDLGAFTPDQWGIGRLILEARRSM